MRAVVFGWMILATSVSVTPLQLSADQPNIVLIYADDQGFGDVSCLNPDSKFQTPNLDRLATEGIAFTNGHSSDSVCTPSRYGLLTGRYSWRTHLKRGVFRAENDCLIPDVRLTLPRLAKQNGYQTAMVGKWHLGMKFPGEFANRDWSQPAGDMPLDKGFDYFFGIPASLNYGVLAWFEGRFAKTPPTLFTGKKPNQRHVDYRIKPPYEASVEVARKKFKRTCIEVAADFEDVLCLERFTDKAIAWMRRHTADHPEKPFFLYVPLTSPHYPVCPAERFHGQGDCGAYGEFMIETDDCVGRILKFLDQKKLANNTIVIFTSDNGPENSWKQRILDFGHRSNGIYREGKRSIYEGGHRVPFIVRWPDRIVQPGRRFNGLVGQVDLLATLADILQVRLPDDAGEDSQSFAEVFTKPASKFQRLPLINHSAQGRFAVTQNRWKLVLPHKRQSIELYDLVADPGETNNLANQLPARVASLKDQVIQIIQNGRTTPGRPQPNDTAIWDDVSWAER